MRGFCINDASVLPVTGDQDVTAIEGYGLGLTGARIPQKNYEGFFHPSKTTFLCFIVGDESGIRADFWAFLRILQVELMMKGRNALIRGTMCTTLFWVKIAPLSGSPLRE
jgi:hypothetical protein